MADDDGRLGSRAMPVARDWWVVRGAWARGRRGLAAIAALVTVAAGGLATAPAAQADEVYPAPPGGIVTLDGHGWGHGRGMSQYGALGAALEGRTWAQIVDFYYQGATRGSIGDPLIRVNVTAHLGSAVRVVAAAGLRGSFGSTYSQADSFALPTETSAGVAVREWRVVRPTLRPGTPSRPLLQYLLADGTVHTSSLEATGPQVNLANPTTGTVTAVGTGSTRVTYRGQLRGALVGSAGAETLVPVSALAMNLYLRSVVPSEMPASWDADALGAQSVAARSYANHGREHPQNAAFYDTCPTTACQVYSGYSRTSSGGSTTVFEYASTNAAISATSGVVMKYNGATAFTQFSSSNGGWTADGGQPYLKAFADPYDDVAANPNHDWQVDVPVSRFESAWPSIGRYLRLRIVSRVGHGEWGGRIVQGVVEGTSGSVTVTGPGLRSGLGLKSEWFKPAPSVSWPSFPRDLSGDGKADVMAVNAANGSLRLYRGNGAGGWGAATTVNTSNWNAMRLAFTAGTWDRDAVSDVMAVWPDGSLYLYPGLPGGGIASGTRAGSGWQIFDAVIPVGDFTGDGCTDLLGRRRDDATLWVYTGNCLGGFLGRSRIGYGWDVFDTVLGAGDLDGDGNVDVVGRTPAGQLWLYPGNGRGGWLPRRAISSGWGIFDALVAPGDFTGDRRGDLLARTPDGRLWVYAGTGRGTFRSRVQVGHGWEVFSHLLP
ncbi:MAG TPA: SpoIID/LytB domain-containing protein [Pedococcus sp.]